jgi:hypothetical protein
MLQSECEAESDLSRTRCQLKFTSSELSRVREPQHRLGGRDRVWGADMHPDAVEPQAVEAALVA